MSEQVNEKNAVETFEKIYTSQFQKCAIAAWNLAIYLSENDVDLSSLPEPVRDSLKYMSNCRKIVLDATLEKNESDVNSNIDGPASI